MKRVLAILICLAMMAVVPACKPDNIQPPAEIITPGEDQQNAALGLGEEENASEESKPSDNEKQEEKPEEQAPPTEKEEGNDTPSEESTSSETEKEEQSSEEPANPNPLAAETFTPSKTAASVLSESGIIKNSDPEITKNRTITFFTANSAPAFSYKDEKGVAVSELDWMKAIAEENGFTLQYQIKPASVSVKAQRTALYAGKKLSLIQLDSSDLASGLTLCASAKSYLDLENTSYGVSKAVLSQSNNKLFAPIGLVDSLWYNSAMVGESDPLTLAQEDRWTVDAFQTLCNAAVEQQVLPLLMSKALPWVTISGVSPIGLVKDQKLDTNLSSDESKSVWSALQKMHKEIPAFVQNEDLTYTLNKGTVMMEYTTLPISAKGINLSYAPLPRLEKKSTNAVTFSGTFFALPKYQKEASENIAALLFAERWCNRYAEVRAGQLQALGIKGEAYQKYADLAEQKGMLILYSSTIEEMIKPFLKGITDESINMKEEFTAIRDQLNGYLTTLNLYY